uniref:Serum amyloid A protein n=1 Tax=Sinocyclocheilus grahami TaxID=75366 RepID=A0A672LEM3_SINGR
CLLAESGFSEARIVGLDVDWTQSAKDMFRAYQDMRETNWKNSDKYFHARGNYDAASRGPGGRWAAEVISYFICGRFDMILFLRNAEADQDANRWGRNGGDPNCNRPKGLPEKY